MGTGSLPGGKAASELRWPPTPHLAPKLKKGECNKSTPCWPFLRGNVPDKRLPTRSLLKVSFIHILIYVSSFTGIQNSVRLYKISWLKIFLKSTNSRLTLFHHVPILRQAPDECRISHQQTTYYVWTQTNGPQQFRLHMASAYTESSTSVTSIDN